MGKYIYTCFSELPSLYVLALGNTELGKANGRSALVSSGHQINSMVYSL